jgi:hypothetical protein
MSIRFVAACDCGYVNLLASAASATYSLRRHSCDLHRVRVARRQRRLDGLASSGTSRPCTHAFHHPHGTSSRYVTDRCRCRPCRDAGSAKERELNARHAAGVLIYVDAGPARAHVAALQAQGMGWKRIAASAGISSSVMWKLLYGDSSRNLAPSKRIRPATAAAILGADLDLAGGAVISAAATTRRLQGLVATGWSQTRLAVRLDMSRSNFGHLIHATDTTITTERAVESLFEELWAQSPPQGCFRDRVTYQRAIAFAARAGWVLPLDEPIAVTA